MTKNKPKANPALNAVTVATKLVGLEKLHLNTAASMRDQQTADLVKVSRAMGHSSLHSTLRYAHTDVEGIREMTNNTWYQDQLAGNPEQIRSSNHE